MTLIQRLQSPTPLFFKKVRKIGLILAAVSSAILAAPATLPAAVVTIATYMSIAGTVATVVSQAATEDETGNKREDHQ